MKDVTSTSFGLVIAFLLPGLALFYGLSFWSSRIKVVLQKLLTSDPDAGLFILVLLGALSLGLLITPFRYLLYERWLSEKDRFVPADFSKLGEEGKLLAFRAAVDEHYRYHQFWGGMTIALPIIYCGWLIEFWSCSISIFLSILIFVLIQGVTGYAAWDALKKFLSRARPILKG